MRSSARHLPLKLTTKFSIVLLCGVCLVLAGYAYLRVRAELATQERDMMRDHRAMGYSLTHAVDRIWQMGGEQAVFDFLEQVNRNKEEVSIRFVWLDAKHGSAHGPQLRSIQPTPVEGQPFQIAATLPGGNRSLFTYLRVKSAPLNSGAIELVESLELERSTVMAIGGRILITAGVISAFVGSVAVGLGILLVARPVGSLIAKARRIGAGDFAGPLILRQSLEFHELALELNAMCDRLAEANERLATETSARIRMLEQLRHADRLATVGKIASSIAHELGTPLQVVLARAKMITSGEVQGERVGANAKVVVEQAERMTRIIRQLLDFARQRVPQKARVDLGQLVRQTMTLLGPVALKSGVQFKTSGETAMFAEIDPDQIQQVLSNLVLNGIQAMPGGGVLTICLEQNAKAPEGMENSDNRLLSISIRDEGGGITEQDLQHVFEPFFTTKGAGDGTGLGLSVCAGIVREHRGHIAVASTPGQGSCFTVYLPARNSG